VGDRGRAARAVDLNQETPMKKVAQSRKLQLAFESVAHLTEVHLHHVGGGSPQSVMPNPCGTSHLTKAGPTDECQ